jgi:hypothetical protein
MNTTTTRIKYDRSGRSTGLAWIVYENSADATKAKQQLDGVAAKGESEFCASPFIRLSVLVFELGLAIVLLLLLPSFERVALVA